MSIPRRLGPLLAGVLCVVSPSAVARADGDAPPFEVAVVLSGCGEVPFAVDPLVASLHARAASDSLASPGGPSRPIRISFRTSACHESSSSVRVAIEVGDGRIVRSEFEVDPSGDTAEDRSVDLANTAYDTLRAAWPNLTAAAGNPYLTADDAGLLGPGAESDVAIDLLPNPYRRVVTSRDLEVASDLATNPYRGAPARIDVEVVGELLPNPYRGAASRTDADVASEVMANPYRVMPQAGPSTSTPRE